MKIRTILILAVLFVSLNLLTKAQEKVQSELTDRRSAEIEKAMRKGSGLDEELKDYLQKQEKEWSLETASEQPYGVSGQIWSFRNEKIRIVIMRFETSEESRKIFELNHNPTGVQVSLIPEKLDDFTVKTYLTNYPLGNSRNIVKVSFSKKIFLVSVEGNRTEAIRFAKHIDTLIGCRN